MQNTKYIKVAVSDRLPEKGKAVIVIDRFKTVYEGEITPWGHWAVSMPASSGEIKYWLEEVPDYEEEVLAMLERMKINIVFTSVRGFDKPLTLEEVDAFSKDVDDLIEKIRRGNVS